MKILSISAAVIASIWIGVLTDLTEYTSANNQKYTIVNSKNLKASRASSSLITSLSNTYSGGGYYSYGRQTINLSGYSGNVLVTFYTAAAPNRFTYYTSGGSYINTSGWVGDANYQGPWGSSLHKGPNTFTVSFPAGQSYGIDVETITDSNAGTRINDYWEINY